jgi:hypothetical protein
MNINALFGRIGRTDSVLLKEDVPMFFAKLPVRCRNSVDDFSVRLQSLADLFEVNLDALRSLAGEKSQEFKLVKLTEFWLKKEKVPNYAQVTNVWRNIVFLRQMPPTHSDIRPQALNAVQFFGQKLPVDYSELWETILNEFSESLIELQKILSDLCLG